MFVALEGPESEDMGPLAKRQFLAPAFPDGVASPRLGTPHGTRATVVRTASSLSVEKRGCFTWHLPDSLVWGGGGGGT